MYLRQFTFNFWLHTLQSDPQVWTVAECFDGH